MAEYLLYGFAQSGNSYKPALYLELARADWTPRFVDFFNGETSWLQRIRSEPRWKHPYQLMPGHPLPKRT